MSLSPRDANALKLQATCWDLFVSMRLVQSDVFSVGLWDTVLVYLHEHNFDDATLEDLIDGCNSTYDQQWALEWTESQPPIPKGLPLVLGAAHALIKELQSLVGRRSHLFAVADSPWEFIGSYRRDFEVLPPPHGAIRPSDQKVDLYTNPGRTLVLVRADGMNDRVSNVGARGLEVHAAEAVRRVQVELDRRRRAKPPPG